MVAFKTIALNAHRRGTEMICQGWFKYFTQGTKRYWAEDN